VWGLDRVRVRKVTVRRRCCCGVRGGIMLWVVALGGGGDGVGGRGTRGLRVRVRVRRLEMGGAGAGM
jgi:hypothetical protein